MKRFSYVMFLSSVLLLTACGGDDQGNGNENELTEKVSISELQGLWRSDGYHYLVEVTDNQFLTYELSDVHCLLVSEVSIAEAEADMPYVLSNSQHSRIATDPDLDISDTHPLYYDRLNAYPDACANGPTAHTDDPVVNFEVFWNIFNEQYAYFDVRGVDWQAVYDEYLPVVEQIRDTGEGDLFSVFEEILPLLNDGHVALSDEDNDREIVSEEFTEPALRLLEEFEQIHSLDELLLDYGNDPQGFEDFEDYAYFRYELFEDEKIEEYQEIIQQYMISDLNVAGNDRLLWGVIDNTNVGYLAILAMDGFADDEEADPEEQLDSLFSALDQALSDLNNTDQLIIDIRINNGGEDYIALNIAGHFFDERRLVYSKYAHKPNGTSPVTDIYLGPVVTETYQKPIYLLTSGASASAAEIFVLAMRELPYVTLIGEPTNGIFSSILEAQLPNGWFFGLSNEVYRATDGNIYEGLGLPVAREALMFDPEFRNQQLDAGIEAVLEGLQ